MNFLRLAFVQDQVWSESRNKTKWRTQDGMKCLFFANLNWPNVERSNNENKHFLRHNINFNIMKQKQKRDIENIWVGRRWPNPHKWKNMHEECYLSSFLLYSLSLFLFNNPLSLPLLSLKPTPFCSMDISFVYFRFFVHFLKTLRQLIYLCFRSIIWSSKQFDNEKHKSQVGGLRVSTT